MFRLRNRKGFTLIEVLLVVVIIAILAGIVIIAVNPGRQIAQTNNTDRSAGIQAILNAVGQFQTDNRGAMPTSITGTSTVVGSGTGQVNICADLVSAGYMAGLPFDPTAAGAHYTDCSDYNTGYTIVNNAGRVTVAAPGAELGEVISVTR